MNHDQAESRKVRGEQPPYTELDLLQIAEVMSQSTGTENYHRLKSLLARTASAEPQRNGTTVDALAKFGYVAGPDGKCVCAYCVRDVDALMEHSAELEMENCSLREKAECLAESEPEGYVCTLEKGHAGQHEAFVGEEVVESWSSPPAISSNVVPSPAPSEPKDKP